MAPETSNVVHAGTLIADIFASTVVYGHVSIAFDMQPGIAVQFVGMQFAARLDVRQHNRLEGGVALVRNNLGDQAAVAL